MHAGRVCSHASTTPLDINSAFKDAAVLITEQEIKDAFITGRDLCLLISVFKFHSRGLESKLRLYTPRRKAASIDRIFSDGARLAFLILLVTPPGKNISILMQGLCDTLEGLIPISSDSPVFSFPLGPEIFQKAIWVIG